jgi:hypothetical protein|tara:strand:- start:1747 stop:2088 length:342 start_codon:yes stop_codon:yes gene_type:complete
MDNASLKISQLQKWRTRRKQDLRIDSSMNAFCRSLKKANKKLLQMQEAWDEFVPEQLSLVAIPISFKGGILEVVVDGSPTAYKINRLIRSGLLRQLQQRCSGTLKQVRVRVDR